MSQFKDHFSQVASAYAQWRPRYPQALFDAIGALAPPTAAVWEPGCGSGQATLELAARFAQVFATDPSAEQLGQHWAVAESGAGKVHLAVEPAEATSLADASVDLIAVAQALHWFDRKRFFAECRRVLRPGGVLAAWTYQDMVFDADLAAEADVFRARIGPYWPAERAEVDAGYAGYAWPFSVRPAPPLWLTAQWTLPQLLGYLGSLSASARYRKAQGHDPVARHAQALASAWGDPQWVREMRWPLVLHLRQRD